MMYSKNPTGIESFDAILDGGLPSGSLILLLGEIGAGDFEFGITTMARSLISGKGESVRNKVCYISLTRGKEDFLKEIAFSFPAYFKILDNSLSKGLLEFKDFSEAYFARSFVPRTWISSDRRSKRRAMLRRSRCWSEVKSRYRCCTRAAPACATNCRPSDRSPP